jgi:secondary thiamine-phosphate synthase enzyme
MTMRQAIRHLTVPTSGKGFSDITAEVARFVGESGIATGLATIFCRHTSASLIIQENADPDVRADLESFFARIAPEGRGLYVHDTEGPDDMPAHIRTALTQSSLGVPVEHGRLLLGTWQGIYLYEHRSAPHRREIVLQVVGE